MKREEDPIERLAQENDRLARQHIRDMNTISDSSARKYGIVALIGFALIVLLALTVYPNRLSVKSNTHLKMETAFHLLG